VPEIPADVGDMFVPFGKDHTAVVAVLSALIRLDRLFGNVPHCADVVAPTPYAWQPRTQF